MTLQVIGYAYPCKASWDIQKLLWCGGRTSWCAAVCLYTIMEDPSLCADCLSEAGNDCCDGGPCGLCNLIEFCYEDDASNQEEVWGSVLSYIGC